MYSEEVKMFNQEVELFCNEAVRDLPKETKRIMIESIVNPDTLCLLYYVTAIEIDPLEYISAPASW